MNIHNIMDVIVHNEELAQDEKDWLLDLISEKHPDVTSLTVIMPLVP